MSRFNRRLALTLTLSLIAFGLTSADDKINGKSDDTNTVAEQRVAWLREKVAAMRVVPTRESNDACKLRQEPIIKWSNPVSGAEGAVFVLTHDGRPIVLAKCHLNSRNSYHVETLISISDNRPRMSEAGQLTWEPSQSGVKFETLDDLGTPATTESLRLAQMRRAAREFRFVDNWGETAKTAKSEWELRLMPAPLLRYSSASEKIIDGALFAFAQGTNPEALVLVEAVETTNGRIWRAAPSRLTGYQVRGWHKDRLVLEVEKIQSSIRTASLFHRTRTLNPFPFPEKAD
ncbi:MAG: hypothetical protein H7062_12065 [Candidatus Saccharimonas sp.]|nr:hypothetical protein [Planctomycetaceae bacterium]